jgi:GWxTD domain-containing protein
MQRTLLLLGLVILSGGPLLAQQPARRSTGTQAAQPARQPNYQRWLDEDVSYIITAEERQAFLLLKTDEQRERFIEQFWKRRDPDPATPENEYCTEHYRRIAYANGHFGQGIVPGWQTARGRIYIQLGAPDEIRQTATWEVWFYRHAAGFGSNVEIEFVGGEGSGSYRVREKP